MPLAVLEVGAGEQPIELASDLVRSSPPQMRWSEKSPERVRTSLWPAAQQLLRVGKAEGYTLSSAIGKNTSSSGAMPGSRTVSGQPNRNLLT